MANPVVLVPLDGSENALAALPIAKVFAGLEKAAVRVVHVTQTSEPQGEAVVSPGLEPSELGDATLEVRPGPAGEAILAAAAGCGATLIVMCADSADDGAAGAIGETALAVLRQASCPVVLLRADSASGAWALRRVLAPHDGSPTVSEGLKPAIHLARAAGAELLVLQVAGDEPVLEKGSMPPPMYVDQIQHSWPAWSGEFLHRLASICPLADLQVRLLVAHGGPADETIRVAREESADLIVLAWRGHWEATQDSMLKILMRDAPCPILVTRVGAA
jgi:nucleotide-binding universal stress UspA family protein